VDTGKSNRNRERGNDRQERRKNPAFKKKEEGRSQRKVISKHASEKIIKKLKDNPRRVLSRLSIRTKEPTGHIWEKAWRKIKK